MQKEHSHTVAERSRTARSSAAIFPRSIQKASGHENCNVLPPFGNGVRESITDDQLNVGGPTLSRLEKSRTK